MKYALLLSLFLLTGAASAAPVHVTLNAAASVTANADGFWTLMQAAALSGGTKDAQTRLASVVVGRVPLPGETRTVTRGDVLLKLRQAGLCPGTDAVVDGAGQFTVTPESVGMNYQAQDRAMNYPSGGRGRQQPSRAEDGRAVLSSVRQDGWPKAPQTGNSLPGLPDATRRCLPGPTEVTVIHPGDPVAIVVQDGAISITARGEAREAGSKGQSIRVHREGVMTDLRGTVVDNQTVQLEM